MGRKKDMIETPLKRELNERHINIEKLLKDYSNGMGEGHIKTKYKIGENLLRQIIEEYCTHDIENKRQAQHENWKIDLMKNVKKEVQIPKVSLVDAIKVVEEGEER